MRNIYTISVNKKTKKTYDKRDKDAAIDTVTPASQDGETVDLTREIVDENSVNTADTMVDSDGVTLDSDNAHGGENSAENAADGSTTGIDGAVAATTAKKSGILQRIKALVTKRSNMDMTVGKPLKNILIFMIPLLIGNVFQQFYSMADTVIVGQTLGDAALSGVGSTGALSFLILGFAQGLSSGFAVITSQRKGANDTDGVRRSIATSIELTVIINIALTLIAVFTCRPLLEVMNTKPEFIDFAYNYIVVIFAGMMLNALYNQFSNTLRAIGDSTAPLIFLIIACLVNIGLDCLLIIVCRMGVEGAAIATLASQGFAALLTYLYMHAQYKQYRVKLSDFKLSKNFILMHLKLGFPMALQFSVISIGMIMSQTALNAQPGQYVTAYVAATKIDNIACAILLSIGTASATFVGQNYGANKFDRIRKGVFDAAIVSAVAAVVLGCLVIALSKPFTSLFIKVEDQTPELFAYSRTYLILNGSFYIFLAGIALFRSALQGMGRGTVVLVAAVVEVIMRVVMSLLSIHYFGYEGVCLANAAAWFGACLVLLPSYFMLMKKIKKRTQADNASEGALAFETAASGTVGANTDFETAANDTVAADTIIGETTSDKVE